MTEQPRAVTVEIAGGAECPRPVDGPRPTQSASPAGSLRSKALAYLQEIIGKTLRMEPGQVAPERSLTEYGLDSILVVGLTNQLRKVFPTVTSTLFFQLRNVAALADYLLEREKDRLVLLMSTDAVSSTTAQSVTAPVAVDMSREKEEARLLRRRRPTLAGSVPAAGTTQPHASFDVAIVGLSGRYPQARNLSEFWRNLAAGRNCITEVPKDRWDWREHFDAEKGKPGKIYSRWGGFLESIDCFDPLFFRISPKEAKAMDPQERVFLEACYHAIEDAGYTPETLGDGDRIGVFVGVMNSRYNAQPLYYSIANRVSFVLDFRGPSMAVDTACSSSLTAIHLALESLYSGLSECALAGGVNLIIDPVHYQELSALTMLSAGNQCRSFAAEADGFVDAEGVGAVVLKPLRKAEQDGDHIYGVIKASAVNAGGRTNGYTVPNPRAQSAVIAKALERANLRAGDISYVEAHGTGTALGDPIEIAGLSSAFAPSTAEKQFCAIGSLKSNIGHCESAAGIAALTKVLLQLKHQQLVPSLHAEVTNPEIDFSQTPFKVQRTLEKWQRPRREVDGLIREVARTAGISSFGAGGSNAHLIVQEYESAAPAHVPQRDSTVVIPLSARTSEQLGRKARDLLELIRAGEPIDLHALSYTLQVGREALEERLGWVVGSIEELAERLEAFSNGRQDIDRTYRGRVKRNQETPPTAAIDRSFTDRDLVRLLDSWVAGVRVDWRRLYGEVRPRRLSLPTYPFARERYWRERPETLQAPPPAVARAVLHPVVHHNVSDIRQQGYRTIFTGNEFFLTDHRMLLEGAAHKVVPAMVYLEMARVAVENATSNREQAVLELFNVMWAEPLTVTSGRQLAIAMFARDADQLDYEIHSLAEEAGQDIVHCQGQALLCRQREPARIDIATIRSQMRPDRRSSSDLYSALAVAGVRYGPAYRGVTALYVGERQLLAELSLPLAAVLDPSIPDGAFVLHPVMLDCALQAGFELLSPTNQPSLPLALESVRILAPSARQMLAWIRYSQGDGSEQTNIQLDIDLCDPQGQVCAQMRGVTYELEAKPQAAEAKSSGVALSAPQSQTFKRTAPSKPTRISLEGGGDLTP